MALPEPCENCRPYGGYWADFRAGAKRCDCERGRALASQDLLRALPPVLDVEPMISAESAALGVSMLSVMKFFPSEEGARLLIADELRSMCANDSQMVWLAKRMGRLFTDWPGLPALRAVFWSKFIPLDRVPAKDEAMMFPDGVPAELPAVVPHFKALAPGSNDILLDAEIRRVANLKKLE